MKQPHKTKTNKSFSKYSPLPARFWAIRFPRVIYKIVAIILVCATFIFGLDTFLSQSISHRTIDTFGLDQPSFVFKDIELDNMSDTGKLGLDPGYYLDYGDLRGQKFVRFDEYHQIRFALENRNYLTYSPVIIDGIYVRVNDFIEEEFAPFLIMYDYGAGETEKIYRVDATELFTKLTKQNKFTIEAKVDESNKEKYDLISLVGEDVEEYFKVIIPLVKHGLLNFNIEVNGRYNGKEFRLSTIDFWIGNSRANKEKWYQNNHF